MTCGNLQCGTPPKVVMTAAIHGPPNSQVQLSEWQPPGAKSCSISPIPMQCYTPLLPLCLRNASRLRCCQTESPQLCNPASCRCCRSKETLLQSSARVCVCNTNMRSYSQEMCCTVLSVTAAATGAPTHGGTECATHTAAATNTPLQAPKWFKHPCQHT